ncbi:hypothetical protein [Lacihabitans lacunae]|uniref:Lipoprotein n=1 Tax=Lacihabitans lacunae TaxID=1028214 RepID=A0ABV7Z061_9BACT
MKFLRIILLSLFTTVLIFLNSCLPKGQISVSNHNEIRSVYEPKFGRKLKAEKDIYKWIRKKYKKPFYIVQYFYSNNRKYIEKFTVIPKSNFENYIFKSISDINIFDRCLVKDLEKQLYFEKSFTSNFRQLSFDELIVLYSYESTTFNKSSKNRLAVNNQSIVEDYLIKESTSFSQLETLLKNLPHLNNSELLANKYFAKINSLETAIAFYKSFCKNDSDIKKQYDEKLTKVLFNYTDSFSKLTNLVSQIDALRSSSELSKKMLKSIKTVDEALTYYDVFKSVAKHQGDVSEAGQKAIELAKDINSLGKIFNKYTSLDIQFSAQLMAKLYLNTPNDYISYFNSFGRNSIFENYLIETINSTIPSYSKKSLLKSLIKHYTGWEIEPKKSFKLKYLVPANTVCVFTFTGVPSKFKIEQESNYYTLNLHYFVSVAEDGNSKRAGCNKSIFKAAGDGLVLSKLRRVSELKNKDFNIYYLKKSSQDRLIDFSFLNEHSYKDLRFSIHFFEGEDNLKLRGYSDRWYDCDYRGRLSEYNYLSEKEREMSENEFLRDILCNILDLYHAFDYNGKANLKEGFLGAIDL